MSDFFIIHEKPFCEELLFAQAPIETSTTLKRDTVKKSPSGTCYVLFAKGLALYY